MEIMAAASRMSETDAPPVPVAQPIVPPQTYAAVPMPGSPVAAAPPVWPLPMAANAPAPVSPPPPASVPRELLPALCELPIVADTDTAIFRAFEVVSNPNGQFAIAMKQLASWASSARQTLGIRTISVGAIGDAPLEAGATAMALARAIGLQSIRVIVVDAARGDQQLDPIAGLSPGPGLAEMLLGNAKFAELITTDGASAVHILRAGRAIEVASQYFSTNRMDAILNTLESSYDAVILNLGNLDARSRELARLSQAGVLLAAPNHAAEVAQYAAEWRQAGLRAVQYVRIVPAAALGGSADRRAPVSA